MPRLLAVLFLLCPTALWGQDEYLIDWDAIGEEAINHLVNLVQIDTTNPPGNETHAANYVKAALAEDGIDSELFALDPDRANLVARINGNGSKRPILIMGHTDVVGVQRERWNEDPFGGLRKDGWI
ncbi:MAG: M20/M25/M40 family metallo-hydrolase, partial [Planctomycetaceae bacterium]|nr:M20/M25/M40 family metallo-hydrolase [Planctomycetaceae bacterium]